MYQQKGSVGARIGALFLDGLFLSVFLSIILFLSFPLFSSLSPVATFLYYGICEGSSMHATLGKRICGLIVVDEQGIPIGPGKAFLRSLCRLLSGLILCIGYIIGLADPEGKALHDKLAGTFVANRVQAMPPMPQPIPQPERRPPVMQINPQLIGVAGLFAGKSFPIRPQGIMMGRDSAACDFVFPDHAQGISRNHCKIQFNPQTQMFVLYDLGSSYGTFLGNGVRVPQGQPMALRPGDEFYLASRANLFRVSL